jgi:MFS family permease
MPQDPQPPQPSAPGRASPVDAPSRADWYLVGVLWCANVFAFIDRQSLPLLVGPIEQDLHISDTEMSLLIGLAFALVFTGLGVPAGILLDRVKRKKAIIAGGVTFWSLATMGCGLAASYGQLFLGRMGVGVGEAVFPPGAVAMMRDAFSPGWRSRAIGFWSSGATIGSGMALLGGGAILGLVSGHAAVELPLVGSVKPWQLVLIVSGALGLLVAALMLTIREPVRKGRDAAAPATTAAAWGHLRDRWRVFLPLACALFSGSIVMFSFQVWTPTLLARVWHLSRPDIGLMYGLMVIVLSPAGQSLAGIAVDRLTRRRPHDAPAIAGTAICAVILAPIVLIAFVPSLAAMWAVAAIYTFMGPAIFTVATVATANLTPAPMMGKVAGLHFFFFNLIGFALGALLVAVVSDRVFAGATAVAYAMASVIGVFDVLAIVAFFVLARNMRGGS